MIQYFILFGNDLDPDIDTASLEIQTEDKFMALGHKLSPWMMKP